jgi:hypothetical protein
MTLEQKETAYDKIREILKPELYQDGTWMADYKRIQIAAVKQ